MIRQNVTGATILALLLTVALGLMLRPLTAIDETRYLAVAWEMHLSGDWLVPTKNFAPYSDKPPLLFWAINLVWMLTGVSELAARIVVPLAAAGAVWLTAVLARRLWPGDEAAGPRAALALAGLVIFVLSGSLTMFDVPLSLAVLAGLIALHQAGKTPARLATWAGFGAALALGVLTKGPVILFHLLPAALALPLWSPAVLNWRQLARGLALALAVAAGMVGLWLVPAAIRGGEGYRDAILWHQSAGRLAGSFAHARPWWFYLAALPLLVFPAAWSPTLWRAARRAPWLQDRGLRLCLIQAGAALLLFSLTSGKQLHYLVPEMPAFALMVARLSRGLPRISLWPAMLALGLVGLLAILAGAGAVGDSNLIAQFGPHHLWISAGLLLLAVCGLGSARPGLAGAAVLTLGALLTANLLVGMTKTARIYSAAPIAARAATARDAGIAWTGAPYHAELNFAARLTSPVATPASQAELRQWMAAHPRGLILGPQNSAAPDWQSDGPSDWPPAETIRFRNRDYGIWPVATAPLSIPE